MEIGVSSLPPLPVDLSDRNRTSPFAFTGNKFEFRAVGSSSSIAPANIAINAAVADALSDIAGELEGMMAAGQNLNAALQDLLPRLFREHMAVVFNGNGYGEAWPGEAATRGLPNYRGTVEALEHYGDPDVKGLFVRHGVLSEREVDARRAILLENYAKTVLIEGRTLADMVRSRVLPEAARAHRTARRKVQRRGHAFVSAVRLVPHNVLIFIQRAVSSKIKATTKRLDTNKQEASLQEILADSKAGEIHYQAMSESEFLQGSANALLVNVETLRVVLESVGFDKKLYNARNIAMLKKEFNRFLFENALSSFEVGFVKIASSIHSTSFTDTNGDALEYVESSNLGIEMGNDEDNRQIPKNYLFKELFYDSQIERENILQDIDKVEVFTKIPKNSLKIPVAGGKSYTPDFAYILKSGDKGQIYCVIESKGKDERDLSNEERSKIARAEKFLEQSEIFQSKIFEAKIFFKRQFEEDTITAILQECIAKHSNK